MQNVLTGPPELAPIILIYGPPKIGKSAFGAGADAPIFQPTEEGLVSCARFPQAKSFQEVLDNTKQLAESEHNFRTYVIDTLDHLEPMIHKQICDEKGVKTIEDVGYGKGYVMALDLWRQYIECLKYLRDVKKMTIVMIAHSEIKQFKNPETDAYDRYQIKLHRGASDLAMENSDIILFVNYYVGVTKKKEGFNKERAVAVGSGERVLYTEERPSFKAGNRFDLPEQIQFTRDGQHWATLAQYIPFFKTQNKG